MWVLSLNPVFLEKKTSQSVIRRHLTDATSETIRHHFPLFATDSGESRRPMKTMVFDFV